MIEFNFTFRLFSTKIRGGLRPLRAPGQKHLMGPITRLPAFVIMYMGQSRWMDG